MKWLVFCSLVVVLISFISIRRNYNNVCKTFDDYYTDRDRNKNCYHNPDYKLDVPDIAERYGYPLEKYEVTTEDGYILTVFRIPYGKDSTDDRPRKPVFLQHGMIVNSGCFVNIGKKSLGFILADAGYDVWMGNFRGSQYSRSHLHLNSEDLKFWDFSFHELGIYDVPAQLDLVNEITKQKVIFIGYSLGSTAAYVYGSEYPDIAQEKVEVFINLAPAVFMHNMSAFAKLIAPVWTTIGAIINTVANGRISPRQALQNEFGKLICLTFPFQMRVCQIPEMIISGFSYEQSDPETLPIILLHNADATSVKTITHFCQLGLSGNFQYFDYGEEQNKVLYGLAEPKVYNLTDVKIPSFTILANNDQGVLKENIRELHKVLPKETTYHGVHVVEDESFNHLDFIAGKDVVPLVYDHVVNFLEKL